MMINPWLSDISGDYLDQPTDFINHHVIDVASHICKYAIYLCMVGKHGRQAEFLEISWGKQASQGLNLLGQCFQVMCFYCNQVQLNTHTPD